MRKEMVLALMSDMKPHQWMSYEDAIVAKYKGLVSWELGDSDSLFRGGHSRVTGLRSTIEVKSVIVIDSTAKYRRVVPPLTNRNLFIRDLNTCSYCGRLATERLILTRDHIVPVSKGGKDTWSNTTAACKRCNNLKDDKLLHETELELKWAPYTPDRNEHLIMQNRNILVDQAKFILDFVPDHSRMKQLMSRKFGEMLD